MTSIERTSDRQFCPPLVAQLQFVMPGLLGLIALVGPFILKISLGTGHRKG